MHSKPTLGYPTRVAAIAALRAEGKQDPEIAGLLGIKTNTVSSLIARQKARAADRVAERYHIMLPASLYEDVRRLADERHCRPETLVCDILRTMVRDKLVDAVLDIPVRLPDAFSGA